MKRILCSFIIVLILCGVSSAQESMDERLQAFWEQKVDTTTAWGQWLTATYKPYIEALFEAIQPLRKLDLKGLSPDEIKKKTNEAQVEYYKALQDITPPDELKAYHMKMLELIGELSKGKLSTEIPEFTDNLTEEMKRELEQVFLRHGVPQEIIDELDK